MLRQQGERHLDQIHSEHTVLDNSERLSASSYLVRLVAQLTAERLGSSVGGLVFVQQGGAVEHLVTGGTLVELLWVQLLDVLPMLPQ